MAQRAGGEPLVQLAQHVLGHRHARRPAAPSRFRPRPVRPVRHRHGRRPRPVWVIAEASAVKKRVSKRRTRPGGVIARAIRNRPDGSGSRPASLNGLPAPGAACALVPALRCRGKGRFPRRLRGSRRSPAHARARRRSSGCPSAGWPAARREIGAATGILLSLGSTRPPGKTYLPGMNTTLSWRLPTSTFGFGAAAIDQDQRRRVLRPEIGVVVFFLCRLRRCSRGVLRSFRSRTHFLLLFDQPRVSGSSGSFSSKPCMRNAHCRPTTAPLTGCSSASDATSVTGR